MQIGDKLYGRGGADDGYVHGNFDISSFLKSFWTVSRVSQVFLKLPPHARREGYFVPRAYLDADCCLLSDDMTNLTSSGHLLGDHCDPGAEARGHGHLSSSFWDRFGHMTRLQPNPTPGTRTA